MTSIGVKLKLLGALLLEWAVIRRKTETCKRATTTGIVTQNEHICLWFIMALCVETGHQLGYSGHTHVQLWLVKTASNESRRKADVSLEGTVVSNPSIYSNLLDRNLT